MMKNVVLFTIDTLRRDVLGCYGGDAGLTPFLDSQVEKATVFAGAHSVAPYTQASFPGLLTSTYLFDFPKSQKLATGRTLISEALKAKGIATAAYHSNPYLSGFFGWNRGWDSFYDSMQDDVDDMSPYIKGDVLNKKVDRWLESHVQGDGHRPFFLWVHYMDVHEPYVPEERYLKQVDPSIGLSKQEMFRLFQEVLLKRDASDPKINELLHQLYRAHVLEVDDYARELFGILQSRGVLEDTTVIVTTDHGDEFGEHGGLSHDGKFFSELVHVPLLVVNPPEGAGEGCDTLVSGLDIPPTVMRLFGLDPHESFQGQPLYPLDRYRESGCCGEAIGKLSHKIKETDRPAFYYREGALKVTYRQEEDRWELYDLEADPLEEHNIIDQSPKAKAMREKLQPRIGRAASYS
ncbi:MAG: sulfatase [Spirochaetales bacterium]|nr:sulfatase [Spirochaetales bacterium]